MKNKARASGHIVRTSGPRLKKLSRKNIIYIVCLGLAAVLLLAVAMILKISAQHQAYNEYMKTAQQCYYNSDYDNALVSLRKAAALEDNAECGMLMAACYEAQGNYVRALEVLRSMDTKSPTVAARIASVEALRRSASEAEKLIIAGRQFSSGTSGLVLDNMGLNSAVFEEILPLYALDSLSLANNAIDDISPLSSLGGLVTLNLSSNRISDISALSSLSALRTLYLDNNPISDFSPLYNLSNLTSLSIKGISITESQLKALSRSLPNCAIHSEAAVEEVQDISFGGTTFRSDATELDLSNMGLRDISAVASCEKLKKLNISGNNISDLSPLMNLPELQWLDISNTQVSDLRPLMGIDSLSHLNAENCNINSTSALSMMNGLTYLNLNGNSIGDFSGLRKLKTLYELHLDSTNLNDEGLQYLRGLSMLNILDVENNPSISGEAMDDLRLYQATCRIYHSELAYTVSFDRHVVQTTAVELSLPGQGIMDISAITRLNKLEKADLSGNYISNLYPLENAECRFVLQELDLSHNSISDATPLSWLLSARVLNLAYNSISSELPFMNLQNLDTLILTGNPLSEEQVQRLRNTLLDTEIIF